MTSGARISDVAAAAGVAVSTVSNVINHPHKVAAATRERVEIAIEQLEFRRSEEAVNLRLGRSAKPTGPKPRRKAVARPLNDMPSSKERAQAELEAVTGAPVYMAPGTRVDVVSNGRVLESGIVEIGMPDGSIIWIWLDNGGGRRLVHISDGLEIRASGDTS